MVPTGWFQEELGMLIIYWVNGWIQPIIVEAYDYIL